MLVGNNYEILHVVLSNGHLLYEYMSLLKGGFLRDRMEGEGCV